MRLAALRQWPLAMKPAGCNEPVRVSVIARAGPAQGLASHANQMPRCLPNHSVLSSRQRPGSKQHPQLQRRGVLSTVAQADKGQSIRTGGDSKSQGGIGPGTAVSNTLRAGSLYCKVAYTRLARSAPPRLPCISLLYWTLAWKDAPYARRSRSFNIPTLIRVFRRSARIIRLTFVFGLCGPSLVCSR